MLAPSQDLASSRRSRRWASAGEVVGRSAAALVIRRRSAAERPRVSFDAALP
jgi:hypothetical protein